MRFHKKIFLLVALSTSQSYAYAGNFYDYFSYQPLFADYTINCTMGSDSYGSLDCVKQNVPITLVKDSDYFEYFMPRPQYQSAYITAVQPGTDAPRIFYQCKYNDKGMLSDCAPLNRSAFDFEIFTDLAFLPDLSSTKNNSAAYTFGFNLHPTKADTFKLLMCPEAPSATGETPSLNLNHCVESGASTTIPDPLGGLGNPAINPAGTFLYYGYMYRNHSAGVMQCTIDQKTHLLSACKQFMKGVEWPSSISFDPTGSYAYLSVDNGGFQICDVSKTDGSFSNCRLNKPDSDIISPEQIFNTKNGHVYLYGWNGVVPSPLYPTNCVFNQDNGSFSDCTPYHGPELST
jgi:hypothetical protein